MLEARRQLRARHLPSWTQYIGAGEPLLATQQNAALFPLSWPAFVFPFWQSLEWIVLLKLLLAGLGTVVLLRRLGLRTPAALFGGLAFGLSLYMVDWVDHPHVNAYLLIPWALWAADRLAWSASVGDASLLALFSGLALLGGQPESAFLLTLIVVPWFFVRGPTRRALGLGAAAALTALALGALMLIPFAELAAHATGLARGGASQGGSRNLLLSFFMPELWGRPDKYEIVGGPSTYFERTAYFGALPLMFAVGGLVARRPRGAQLYFAIAGLLALGLVVHVPLYTKLVTGLPVFREVQLGRALAICAFCGAVLGAYGFDALLAGERRTRLRLLAGVAAAGLVPVVWVAGHGDLVDQLGRAWHQLPVMSSTPAFRPALQMGAGVRWILLAAAGVALTALVAWRPRVALGAAVVALAITAVDLVSLGRGFNPTTPIAWADPPPSQAVRFLGAHLGHARVAGGPADLGPNVAERFQLRDPRLHEQPVIERRRLLWDAVGGEGYLQRVWLGSAGARTADIFGVRYAFIVSLAQKPPAGWKKTPVLYLLERARPRPRAFVAYGWKPAAGMDSALQIVKTRSDGGDQRAPVIEGAPQPPAAGAGAPTPATFVRDDDRHVTLTANARKPGWLVLDDTYYPGWHATVDGRPVKIHAANVAFRAVPVPAGRHTIDFDYSPASVRWGLILSLLALAAIAAGLTRAVRSRSAPGPGTGR